MMNCGHGASGLCCAAQDDELDANDGAAWVTS